GAAVLSGGFSRTVAVEALIESGMLARIEAPHDALRRTAPIVRVAGEEADLARDPAASSAHLPSVAWEAARAALAVGPVLVQVPRRGYLPSMSCATCRRPARCAVCAGPVAITSGSSVPQCRWCARPVVEFACPHCGDHRLRAAVTGARRTAEELGRAFRGIPVHTSGSGQVLTSVAGTPALVIATPGAEPVAEGGYAACLLLDAWASLDRPTLDSGEEALRRWLAAAALVRPRGASPTSPEGRVVLVGAPTHTPVPAVEALVRWDPGWFAGRELADRSALGLPPARRAAIVQGERVIVAGFVGGLELPPDIVVLGPTPVAEAGHPGDRATAPQARAVLLGPVSYAAEGGGWPSVLRLAKAARSARKEGGGLTVRLDPRDLA
ncbi:MAG: primosome assembly protein PriA, partial [Nostocoides sp.]